MSMPATVALVTSLCVSMRIALLCTRATSSSVTVRFWRPGACAGRSETEKAVATAIEIKRVMEGFRRNLSSSQKQQKPPDLNGRADSHVLRDLLLITDAVQAQ